MKNMLPKQFWQKVHADIFKIVVYIYFVEFFLGTGSAMKHTSVTQILGYSNIFESIWTNIFIRQHIC